MSHCAKVLSVRGTVWCTKAVHEIECVAGQEAESELTQSGERLHEVEAEFQLFQQMIEAGNTEEAQLEALIAELDELHQSLQVCETSGSQTDVERPTVTDRYV